MAVCAKLVLISLAINILFVLMCSAKFNISIKSMKGFGPFKVTTKSFELCVSKSPIDEENACFCNVYVNKISRTEEEFKGFVGIPKDIINTGASLVIEQWKDGGFQAFFNRTFAKPCDNVIFEKIIKNLLKTGPNCLIRKGNFSIQGVNTNEFVHMFMGENFFYERLAVTLEWFSTKGSTCCIRTECETSALRKPKKKS